MRYHYEKPTIYLSMYGKRYICNHPVYDSCTLFEIGDTGGFSNSSLEFEDANEEQRLFYDSFSKRYFQATISQVLQAEYHINRNMVLGAFVTLNDFYDFLGISHVEGGDVVGWLLSDSMYWIDFDNSKAIARLTAQHLLKKSRQDTA